MDSYRYVLDAEDRIAAISDDFSDFAEQNGAPELPASVLGQPVWRYLTDPTTHQLYGLLFSRVRRDGQPVSVPFRCDAPDVVREMELTITPLADQGIRLEGRTLQETPRPSIALLDDHAERTEEFIRMCGWCKKIHVDGDWVEVEAAIAAGHLFDHAPVPKLSHGICEVCTESVWQSLDTAAGAPSSAAAEPV